MDLARIVDRLDSELSVRDIPDYPGAMNGLQLQNDGSVTRVCVAVDATLPVIKKAIEAKADLLIVHHGLFWQGAQTITGATYRKYKAAMDANLALYSCHIPLDVHPTLGNNAVLARKVAPGVSWEPFFDWKGIKLGLRAQLNMTCGELADSLESVLGTSLLLGPSKRAKDAGMTAIITGGAGSEVGAMAAEGIETFISGEAPHWAHGMAEESGLSLLLGGHYATETFGVIELGTLLQEELGLPWLFLEHPSGL